MRRILVVDDSRSVRQSFEASLEPYGFEVDQAENGAVALAKLRRSRFDLVFLDLNMPVLDGPGMLRIIRHSGIPVKVVLVTSGAPTATVASTVKLGAGDYVQKPFTAEQVREAVAKSLELDLSGLRIVQPMALVQHPDAGLRERIRKLFPSHVAVDGDGALARCLELAEGARYRLVLLDHRVLDGEVETAADLVRARLPEAAILELRPGAAPAERRAPHGELDGAVPDEADEAVAEFLYASYLRPLVFPEPTGVRVAGHRGPTEDEPAYFAQLRRGLRASSSDWVRETGEVVVDLQRLPEDADQTSKLVREVQKHFAEKGIAATFTVSKAMRNALSARAELSSAVILESSGA
ncbi:MAG TPA: response regulator [Anaeromyxobacteraceae bacterium]|nr:response regulator [Anaeromyxobacteraceae bacterium]